MARKQKVLPEVEEVSCDSVPLRTQGKQHKSIEAEGTQEGSSEKRWRSMSKEPRHSSASKPGQTLAQPRTQISRANRIERYEAVQALHQQLVSEREIARSLSMSRNTVHKFLTSEVFPERCVRPRKASLLDPYKPYILERWKAGCWNGTQILAEIKKLGYTGSEAKQRLFLSSVSKGHQTAGTATALSLDTNGDKVSIPSDLACKPYIKRRLSPARASWLYISQVGKLDEKQKQHVELIRVGHPDLNRAYQLTQMFVCMLAEHRDTDLSQWSNGPVEAQVNCLQLQKRLMFGRANFDLLRLHVLRRA
jgi:transposase